MSKLKDILSGVNVIDFYGDMDVEVNNVQFDSREITDGDAFVAIKGIASDGHEYINSCIEKGAKAIIYDNSEIDKKEGIAYILVKDSNEALGYLAANHFNNPSEKIKLIGITGTNGKTTCATLLHQLFMNLGYQVGLLSTIENKINNDIIPSTHTTPDPIQLNMLLSKMVKQGCSYCFMEVSSHAVVQHRITGLSFDGGIFTNISHDHLDYHKTFDEYICVT